MASERKKAVTKTFALSNVRILKVAELDDGARLLNRESDLGMLCAFLERFDQLGWLPPLNDEKRKLLAANDVIIHVVGSSVSFYEFCSKGARGERKPWLSVFFHVDAERIVRICGLETVHCVRRHHAIIIDRIHQRVQMLRASLERRGPDRRTK